METPRALLRLPRWWRWPRYLWLRRRRVARHAPLEPADMGTAFGLDATFDPPTTRR